MRQRGCGLAEPHVVGKHAAEPEFGEELQPRQATSLIVAQFADELRRLLGLFEFFVGKASEQFADPIGCETISSGGAISVVRVERTVVAWCVMDEDERVLIGAAIVVGELHEFERFDLAVVGLQIGELLTLAS